MLNAAEGARLKRDGMQAALNFSGDTWAEDFIAEFREWLQGLRSMGITTCTIEQFRAQATSHPKSSHAWGSAPKLAMKAGLIVRAFDAAGEPIYRKAAAPKTRAHPIALYTLADA